MTRKSTSSHTHVTMRPYRRTAPASSSRSVKDYEICTRYTLVRDSDQVVVATYDAGCQIFLGGTEQVVEIQPGRTINQIVDCNANPTDPICAQLIAAADSGPSTRACPTGDQSAGTAYAGIGANSSLFGPTPQGDQGNEAYGWIYTNSQTGAFKYDPPTVVGLSPEGTAQLPPFTTYPGGWQPYGWYHTHPYNTDLDSSQTNGPSHFSATDFAALGYGLVMYVGVRDTDNADSGGTGLATRFYSYNKSTGIETLVGHVGSGGC